MLRLEPVRLFTGSAPQEACRLQLKKFKEALPNDLKEQKRALLDAIYLEIEENLPGEHAGGGQDSCDVTPCGIWWIHMRMCP